MSQVLSEKAMLVKLSISKWSARKLDKKVTREVADKYGTDQDRGRYNKVLLAKTALEKITQAESKGRTFHYAQTLPWKDDGWRILPSANYFNYTEEMRRLRAEFDDAVREFLDSYPSLVEEARWQLNGLFNPEDYPSIFKMANKFCFEVEVNPMPTAADFRVDLQADEVARIQKEIEARANKGAQVAMQDLWNRLHGAVSSMAERLSDPDKIFRDSLVTNLVDLVDLLPRLNLTGDANLAKMAEDARVKLTAYDPQTLRDHKQARAHTAQAANDILAAMAGYCEAV